MKKSFTILLFFLAINQIDSSISTFPDKKTTIDRILTLVIQDIQGDISSNTEDFMKDFGLHSKGVTIESTFTENQIVEFKIKADDYKFIILLKSKMFLTSETKKDVDVFCFEINSTINFVVNAYYKCIETAAVKSNEGSIDQSQEKSNVQSEKKEEEEESINNEQNQNSVTQINNSGSQNNNSGSENNDLGRRSFLKSIFEAKNRKKVEK